MTNIGPDTKNASGTDISLDEILQIASAFGVGAQHITTLNGSPSMLEITKAFIIQEIIDIAENTIPNNNQREIENYLIGAEHFLDEADLRNDIICCIVERLNKITYDRTQKNIDVVWENVKTASKKVNAFYFLLFNLSERYQKDASDNFQQNLILEILFDLSYVLEIYSQLFISNCFPEADCEMHYQRLCDYSNALEKTCAVYQHFYLFIKQHLHLYKEGMLEKINEQFFHYNMNFTTANVFFLKVRSLVEKNEQSLIEIAIKKGELLRRFQQPDFLQAAEVREDGKTLIKKYIATLETIPNLSIKIDPAKKIRDKIIHFKELLPEITAQCCYFSLNSTAYTLEEEELKSAIISEKESAGNINDTNLATTFFEGGQFYEKIYKLFDMAYQIKLIKERGKLIELLSELETAFLKWKIFLACLVDTPMAKALATELMMLVTHIKEARVFAEQKSHTLHSLPTPKTKEKKHKKETSDKDQKAPKKHRHRSHYKPPADSPTVTDNNKDTSDDVITIANKLNVLSLSPNVTLSASPKKAPKPPLKQRANPKSRGVTPFASSSRAMPRYCPLKELPIKMTPAMPPLLNPWTRGETFLDITKEKTKRHISISEKLNIPLIIPEEASTLMGILEQKGYWVKIVGGFVRDTLIEKSPHDIDMLTNCPPQELSLLLPEFKAIQGYVATEIIQGIFCKKGERPSDYDFDIVCTTSLEDSLRERDLTVNTLTCDKTGKVEDLFNIIGDFEKRYLVLMKRPEESFKEDPSRMLRLCRFKTQMETDYNDITIEAIKSQAYLIAKIPFFVFSKNLEALFLRGEGYLNYQVLKEYGLPSYLFRFDMDFTSAHQQRTDVFIENTLKSIDESYRLSQNHMPTRAHISALFMLKELVKRLYRARKNPEQTIDEVAYDFYRRFNDPTNTKSISNLKQHIKAYYQALCPLLNEAQNLFIPGYLSTQRPVTVPREEGMEESPLRLAAASKRSL